MKYHLVQYRHNNLLQKDFINDLQCPGKYQETSQKWRYGREQTLLQR